MSKWKGTTADDMNLRVRQGLVSSEDLQDWANTANPFLCSIQWYVDYYTTPMATISDQNSYLKTYQLYCRKVNV